MGIGCVLPLVTALFLSTGNRLSRLHAFFLKSKGGRETLQIKQAAPTRDLLPTQKAYRAPTSQLRSIALLDSGRLAGDHFDKAIAFYTMAVAFNQRNVNAWRGLISAYRGAGRKPEAAQAQKKMRAIFGERFLTCASLVESYGLLQVCEIDSGGPGHIQYRSFTKNQDNLLQETYMLTRAFLIQTDCTPLSLFAETERGTGMLVRFAGKTAPATFEEFRSSASVTYVK